VRVWFYSFLLLITFMHTHVAAQSQAAQQDAARQQLEGAVNNAPMSDNAQQASSMQEDPNTVPAGEAPSPLSNLGDDYTNSIELLRNRFRVDYNVEEITMVFFREYGSAPVVLVRPDGSKLFQGRVDEERVEWYDSDTFDMIKIKNPVPGPWQAVGQVLKGSRVMVLSDVQLHADPLPSILFAGEILKSTAYLTNDGKLIENKQFRDVVDLDIQFISTNNPNYDNFGADDQNIATFQDNGRGMDERPGDGVFTGQFNLKVAAGEWKPIFKVKTPMYTREQQGANIILYKNPVMIDVQLDGGGEGYHKIIIDVDRELVDIASLLIDGKVRFPNTDMQNFSLTEGGNDAREHLIVAYEEGIFRVKLTAYGTTVDGRDFILDVPEYTFLAEGPVEPEVEDPLIDGKDPIVDGSEPMIDNKPPMMADDMAMQEESDEIDSATLTILLIAVNGTIVVIGVVVAIVIILKRKKGAAKQPTEANKAGGGASDASLSIENEPKGVKKLFSIFKKKPKEGTQ